MRSHAFRLLCFCVFATRSIECIRFLSIVSMQRSSSTFLNYNIHLPGYTVYPVNELFQNNTHQSGDIWRVDGTAAGIYNYTSVKAIPPSKLHPFLDALYNRKCQSNVNCIVIFKQFSEQLTPSQHMDVWKHKDLITVVLERNIFQRWKSKWFAHTNNDWTIDGAETHQHALKSFHVPPLTILDDNALGTQGTIYCHDSNVKMCKFYDKHVNWYSYVRSSIPFDERIDVTYDDVVRNISAVNHKIYNHISQIWTHDFAYVTHCVHTISSNRVLSPERLKDFRSLFCRVPL